MPAERPSELASACNDLAAWIPEVEALIAQPDEEGVHSHSQAASAPPWNPRVAAVITDVHEGSRRLEASLRLALTGELGRRRGGSDAHTLAAIAAIAVLGVQLGADAEAAAMHLVSRWITAAQQLPAVDIAPVWRRLLPGPDGLPPRCPYCSTFSLRVAQRTGVVMCWYGDCADGSGRRPTATMEIGRVSGEPMLVWADGQIQVPPEPVPG